MFLYLSLPCQLSYSDQYLSGDKKSCFVHVPKGGRKKDCMTCTYSCMMGPSVEIVHAQSGKVLYSPIPLCVDDEAKSGAKCILFHFLEREIY